MGANIRTQVILVTPDRPKGGNTYMSGAKSGAALKSDLGFNFKLGLFGIKTPESAKESLNMVSVSDSVSVRGAIRHDVMWQVV